MPVGDRGIQEGSDQPLGLLDANVALDKPQEFMQRLAALVPRPRLDLIRFHGVLAPHAKLRPAVAPDLV
jgi:hypothetical protein